MRIRLILFFLILCGGCSESSKDKVLSDHDTQKLEVKISTPAMNEKVLLSVQYYSVEKDAYDGETPINAVLEVPETSKWESTRCFDSKKNDSNEDDPSCPIEWTPFIKACENNIPSLLKEAASSKYELDGRIPEGTIVRFNKLGGEVFISRSYFGGTGGGRYDWNIFLLKWNKKDRYLCPALPFLSGVEITAGALSWGESSCKKTETYKQCVERIFYRKENAFRLDFTDAGTRMSKIPNGYVPNLR